MSGAEGPFNRFTTESVEGIGKESMLVSCSAKTKAEEVPPCGKFLNWMRQCKIGKKAEETSSCVVEAVVAKAETAAGGAGNNKPEEPKNLMSNSEIRWILKQKPSGGLSFFEGLNPDLKPSPEEEMDESRMKLYSMARSFYESEETIAKLQEWVRHELETKGYVELDDEWIRGRAETAAAVEEAWKEIEAMLLSETEDDDDYDSDDEEDEDDF